MMNVLSDQTPAAPTTTTVRLKPRRKRRPVAVPIALVWIAILVFLAIGVQWLPIADYAVIVGKPNMPPNWGPEFLGTDGVGRSTLSRVAYGARTSVTISFLATAISMTIGATLGLLSTYFRGAVTRIIDIAANSVLAVPSLLLLMAIVLAIRPSLWNLTAALSIVFIPNFMRLSRANALTQMNRDFVVAARAMGASGFRLMTREVLPNSVMPLISYAVAVLPGVIITEGSLSYLGLGLPIPTPSWGGMVAAAQLNLQQYPWPAVIPCIVLFITVFAVSTVGDALRARFDVREANV